jgi:acetolactate synthase-1/2/3 large subunit
MIRVADYIMNRLHEEGVRHLFMVTGRGNLFLSDAIARHHDLTAVCVHHEQAASFAAMAYAQQNEQIGVCLVSTGCAATNAITGLLCAWQDDVPCVFLSGQNKLEETVRHTGVAVKTYGQQEADIVQVVSSLTKYAVMLTDPELVAVEIDKALWLCHEGRRGPVWIDIPLNVQNMRVDPDKLERFKTPTSSYAPHASDVLSVASALNAAQRPALMIGSGVRSSGAIQVVTSIVEALRLPVVFASSAVDAYGAANELSIGAVGSLGGTRAGNFVMQNCDLLLIVGCRLSTFTTGEEFAKFARHAQVIVVDIDPVEHSKKTVRIDQFIHADARLFLQSLASQNVRQTPAEWISKCLHWKRIFPKCEDRYRTSELVDLYYLASCLNSVLSADAVVVTDSGLTELLIPSTVEFHRGQRCLHPASQGSMGYALPAAVGAHYAHGGDVIAVVGDGSVMMNIQELLTISYHRLPIKILVTNNNMYSVIRTRQKELFRSRSIGTDPGNGVGSPDFRGLAEGFELPYARIDISSDLKSQLSDILALKGPVVCEIMCVQDQEYIHSSFCHNAERRVVRRPLEDQAPFLDRDLFLSEMIVAPIDQ